jgi:hypothetical protein
VQLVLLACATLALLSFVAWAIPKFAPAARRYAAILLTPLALIAVATLALHADEPKSPKAAEKAAEAKPAPRKLVAPKGWPEGHPLPVVGSNCVACHLTAGRELTDAVKHFVRSAHDLQELTCYDCHGGNREVDAKAHEEEFHFIGTKLSAHLKACSECHSNEAEQLAAGLHHWDFSKRINTKFPTCVDCHGNHDVGNPPAEFKLTDMCLDCHHALDKDFPQVASIVRRNDQLTDVLRKVRTKNIAEKDPIPEAFRKDLSKLRTDTMQLIHSSKEVPAEQAKDLNGRSDKVRTGLEDWLKSTK